jgi:flagellar hook-basal body complex protein FliE
MEVRQLAAGEPVSLHEVMIHLEEAKLSFQLLAQVRNRLLEAYQDVMRTQV